MNRSNRRQLACLRQRFNLVLLLLCSRRFTVMETPEPESPDDKLQYEAAALLIEIQDLKGVTQVIVNSVVSRVNTLFESFLGVLQNSFKSRCGPHDAVSINEISDVLNSFLGQNVFEGVDTRKNLDAYIDAYEGLVKPVKKVLKRKKVIKGNTTQEVPVEWGYYVPFLPSLEKLLSCPEALHCVDNPQPHTPGVFKTALDGGYYRNHELVKRDPLTLGVGMYADGAEVTDSASTKSGLHGLTFVYWTLYNLHQDKRSTLRSIGLLAVVRSTVLKTHGYWKLLKNFINDMNLLSSAGASLNLRGKARHFHGLFICASGDNPGSANLGRFKESASFSKKPCRQCYVSQEDLYRSFKQEDLQLRTKDRHLADVLAVEANGSLTTDENPQNPSVQCGVNGRSVLMSINGCDVTKCLPQDFMHDTLEGTLKLDIACTIHHVLEKKSMSLNEINHRIKIYSKFVGVNKPARIDSKHVYNFKLRLTAAEALNLAYILPFVLRKKDLRTGRMVSVCDKKNLLLLILRLNHMDLVMSEEHSTVDVMHIGHLLEVHHKLFQELYPGKEIPKMHFELHIIAHILLFGPPRWYWCMRYEAKHAFFKRRWRLYRSLKDHAGTLALAHQRSVCGRILLCSHDNEPFLQSADKCGASCLKKLSFYGPKTRMALQELSPDTTVLQFKVVTVKGVCYRKGSAIITSFHEQPVFGKVVHIFKVSEKLVFVYQKLDTVEFRKPLNSFKVRHCAEFSTIEANSLPYNHKLHFVQQVETHVIVPCRSFLSTQDFNANAMA